MHDPRVQVGARSRAQRVGHEDGQGGGGDGRSEAEVPAM